MTILEVLFIIVQSISLTVTGMLLGALLMRNHMLRGRGEGK